VDVSFKAQRLASPARRGFADYVGNSDRLESTPRIGYDKRVSVYAIVRRFLPFCLKMHFLAD